MHVGRQLRRVHRDERGHAAPALGAIVAAVGAVLLGIGAANDTGALAVIGAIVLALGLVLTLVVDHITVDYDIFRRLESLEKK
ncbi:MAG TPA: hypothetical protein VFC53_10840 [Dehalococcoidia bacterium]|jgi:TRAP-type mannitol/chloroaromatic compound transport system permease large subunit|nr:hypothetical protein [Dehalococcoidia bacterium]